MRPIIQLILKEEVIYTKEQRNRRIELKIQDYFAAEITGNDTYLTTSITEDAVQEFCGGCDNLQEDGICRAADENDQARYAARKWCGWVSVKGVRGEMTGNGFNDGQTQL